MKSEEVDDFYNFFTYIAMTQLKNPGVTFVLYLNTGIVFINAV